MINSAKYGVADDPPDCAPLHPGYRPQEPAKNAPSRKNPLASRERLAKHRLPGVLAVAGTSVLAFRKPVALGDHSFQDIRMDCSKGRKPVALEEYEQGPPACRVASILSKTAGAGGET
jgi:hypothetical protein